MSISPTRISGPKASTNIDQDWSVAMKDPRRKIPLELSESLKKKDPDAYNALSQLTPDQLKSLKAADKDKSGTLSLNEVKGFLLKNGQLQGGGKFDNFAEALNVLFSKAAGKKVDVRTPNADVLYLQFNNNKSNKSNQTAEKNGLKNVVANDPDKPQFTGLDVTSEFNKGPTEAQTAFRAGMQQYLDGLVKNGGTMTGLVISGHSNGTEMGSEGAHHMYSWNLDIRAELKRFKDMESPPGSGTFPYKAIFEKTEKVGLLACFQGGAVEQWRDIFPNATIGGTTGYSPDAGSRASPAIYGACQAASQYHQDGGDFLKAEKVGRSVPGSRSDGLQGERGLQISVPSSPAERLKVAQASFDSAKTEYAKVSKEIDDAVKNGSTDKKRMRVLYEIAKKYENAAAGLTAAGGSPGVDPVKAQAVSARLCRLRGL
ncbi:MAG: hypothetical protein JNM17_19425 [Archangium sp.]|nr:hypothetical protein [Archangium sp.]